MWNGMTRARVIQIWFVAVLLVVLGSIVLGASVTGSTAISLLILAAAPPVILLFMWPGQQPPTASEVIHSADRRP